MSRYHSTLCIDFLNKVAGKHHICFRYFANKPTRVKHFIKNSHVSTKAANKIKIIICTANQNPIYLILMVQIESWLAALVTWSSAEV